MKSDLKPLPAWKQAWRRGGNRRREARQAFKTVTASLLTLVVSVLGATLISYGVYQVYAPAGYIVGGIMCWLLLWSHEQDGKGRQ